jgi:hypothetical protein
MLSIPKDDASSSAPRNATSSRRGLSFIIPLSCAGRRSCDEAAERNFPQRDVSGKHLKEGGPTADRSAPLSVHTACQRIR